MLRSGRSAGNQDRGAAALAGGLGPALLLVFFASLSTGAVNNGVFFIAQESYGFGRTRNLLLGLLVGGVYVPAALAVGPGLRRLAAGSGAVTTRRALVGLMVVMAGLCVLPVAARTSATIWLFAALYIPLMGALWPIVESYISGGRRGDRLRAAIGSFNLVWAVAVAAAAWAMAPLLDLGRPLTIFLGLGFVHLMCLAPIAGLHAEPPENAEDAREPHPPSYVGLLGCFRWLLALSYVLLSAINPLLPWRLDQLGLEIGWQMPLVSTWMVSRVGMFFVLQRWGGWHGRWRTPAWASGLMVSGFLVVLLAGSTVSVMAGLAMFGAGLGAVYAASLYYAMEVGSAKIDAGGKHEAIIGAGYGLGPLLGLGAVGLVGANADGSFAPTLAGLSVAASAVFVVLAVVSAWKARRQSRPVAR